MGKQLIERAVEQTIFASRWLLVPCYLGLIGALGMITAKFAQELFHYLPTIFSMTESDLILAVLSMVDLTLAANLVLMVIMSGYENSVSKLEVGEEQDRPDWLGTIDLGGLKLKLISSMVAISGIHLLKSFMNIHNVDREDVKWMVIMHVTFVFSGVLLAVMDWLMEKAHALARH